MNLQVQSQKAAEIMYLEENKQQGRYHPKYFTDFQVRTKVIFIL